MELTVGYLKKVLNELSDDVVLAHLDYLNTTFKPQLSVKRLMVVRDESKSKEWGGKTFLVINGMGSHFTGKGEQNSLKYTGVEFNDESFK